jgi:uncharacterized protein (TIGR03437 family)
LTVPSTQVFAFGGTDPGGRTWSQQLSVQFLPSPTTSKISGVSNGATFGASFAPGMVMSVFGSQLAVGAVAAASVPLPTVMSGVSATVNGFTAPLYYVSPGQLNLQLPYQVAPGPATLTVNTSGGTVSYGFTVSAVAPGIFMGGGNALVPSSTARRGDFVTLFMTGAGAVTPSVATGAAPTSGTPISQLPRPVAPVTVTVGGIASTIQFLGIPPALVGTAQINFQVPSNAPAGVLPVVVTVGGVSSPPANLSIVP